VPASTAGSQTAPAPAPAQPRDVPIAASEEAKQAAPEEAARKAAPKATPKAAPKAAPKASSSGVRRVKAVVEAETGIRFPFAIKFAPSPLSRFQTAHGFWMVLRSNSCSVARPAAIISASVKARSS
jgi:hypothetical protein